MVKSVGGIGGVDLGKFLNVNSSFFFLSICEVF